MRRNGKGILAVVIGLSLLGAGGGASAQAQLEDALVVYSAADAALVNSVVAAFNKKYPAIKMSTVVAGTGELIKRIEAERERPLGDIAWSLGLEAVAANKALFEPYLSREAPSFVPGQLPADRLWTPFTTMPYVIMYNKKLVGEADRPESWTDVLHPRWKGKVAYADATKSGSSYTLLVTWLTLYGKGEAGWGFVENLLRQSKVLPKSAMTYKGVADGEYPIGLTFEYGAYDFVRGGAPVGIIYPAEGTAVIPDGSALIKNARHPKAARAFLDFTVSREIQQLVVEKFGARSVRKDVGPPPGLPSLEAIKAIAYDMEWAGLARGDLLKKFQDVLIKTQ
ncbi:MAG: extracellular solute-binding protein [candidate division NC10 bacterium]|nr:extracellular solute-binding protein [candidate division NC10 bacterium]